MLRIELKEVTINEISNGYIDNEEEGVVGYNGSLNIRPKYQREFVYDEKKRNAVIETIRNSFPLNIMYWVKNEDGSYEVLDGQQRTISFCQYVKNEFSIKINGYDKKFGNLTEDEQKQILDYKLMIYICEGTDSEKLAWFKIINIAGERLTDQELRNATYTGTWLTHAKSIFSKTNCAAYNLSKKYVNGSPIRQDLLERALIWISKGNITEYMSAHQHDPNANELWTYYRNVIEWIGLTFTIYRKEMKGLDWGKLYDEFKDVVYDTNALEEQIQQLMMDDDVTNKKGIYSYVLTHDEKYLNIRAFTESQKRSAYERQNGVCPMCGEHFEYKDMQGDHITPWSRGGKTNVDSNRSIITPLFKRGQT